MSTAAGHGPHFATGVLITIGAGVVLSTGGPILRQIEDASGFQIVFWRSLAQMLLITALLAVRERGRLADAFRSIGGPGLAGGLFLGMGFFGYVFSITNTTVANTLFLVSTVPLFTAALARPVLGERVGAVTWLAIAVALVGVAVMVGRGLEAGRAFGNAMGLFCAVGTALFIVSVRRGARRGRGSSDMVPTVCVAGFVAALAAFALAGGDVSVSASDLFWSALSGAFQIGLGFMLYTIASHHVPAAELSLLGLLEVVLGPVWVWLLLAEVPDAHTLTGGAIVLSAVAGLALWRLARARAGGG